MLMGDAQSMRTLRVKNRNLEQEADNAGFDDVVSGRRRPSVEDDAFYGISKEIYNF